MKYRELKPNEVEAYNVGYKVGARQIIITDIEFESPSEKALYRKGYNAGCQDRLRSNVSNVSKITQTAENQENLVSNVSNVSNVKPIIVNTIVNDSVNVDVNTKKNTQSGIRTHETKIANQNENPRVHNALEIFGNSFRATDAVVDVFDRPDGTTKEGIRIKNPRLMAFVRQRFDKATLTKASDWAIDHNQHGHTYNASSLLKLLCKFQTDIEPAINYNGVQSQYLTFEYQNERKEAQQ